jgi:hypothetical protein
VTDVTACVWKNARAATKKRTDSAMTSSAFGQTLWKWKRRKARFVSELGRGDSTFQGQLLRPQAHPKQVKSHPR